MILIYFVFVFVFLLLTINKILNPFSPAADFVRFFFPFGPVRTDIFVCAVILSAGPIHRIGPHEIQPYLVGDSAYPLSRWLQKPYPEGTRDPNEIRFNQQLSAARVKVECAFGILKGRWRILSSVEEASIARVSKIIVACAVLHNFCILTGDEWDDDDSDDGNDGQNPNYNLIDDGDTIREILKDHL